MARLTGASDLVGGPGSLSRQIAGVAESLTDVLDQAAGRSLAIPPPIGNLVHDLRGWASRIDQGMAGRPTAVDTTQLLAYLRGMPDHQLLALLADLPWARLDALLDAVNHRQPLSRPGSQRP